MTLDNVVSRLLGTCNVIEDPILRDILGLRATPRTQADPKGYRVYRHSGVTELEVDLPGRVRDDVTVQAEGPTLIIHVKATDTRKARPEQRFVFEMEPHTDVEHISAKLENGVLCVSIPSTKADPHKVSIKIG